MTRLRAWTWTVPLLLLLGFLSGWLSASGDGNGWYAALRKPAFLPPAAVFPVVWSALYMVMGFVLADLIEARRRGRAARRLFVLQLALNLAWAPLFFGAHAVRAALIEIVALDLALLLTIAAVGRVRRAAAWALVPYAAWLALATALNLALLQLNPAAG